MLPGLSNSCHAHIHLRWKFHPGPAAGSPHTLGVAILTPSPLNQLALVTVPGSPMHKAADRALLCRQCPGHGLRHCGQSLCSQPGLSSSVES